MFSIWRVEITWPDRGGSRLQYGRLRNHGDGLGNLTDFHADIEPDTLVCACLDTVTLISLESLCLRVTRYRDGGRNGIVYRPSLPETVSNLAPVST